MGAAGLGRQSPFLLRGRGWGGRRCLCRSRRGEPGLPLIVQTPGRMPRWQRGHRVCWALGGRGGLGRDVGPQGQGDRVRAVPPVGPSAVAALHLALWSSVSASLALVEQPTSRRFYPERGSLSLHVWSQPREQGATLHDCSPTLGKGTQALAGPVPAAHVTSSKGPSRAGVRAQVKQQTPVPATSVSRRRGCSASRGSKPRAAGSGS